MSGRMAARQARGFTLIELLVVMAIVAILAALLFPVFVKVREKGCMAVCQSNLRQIGMAFEMYLLDYDETYPCTGDPFLWMGRKWRWPLKPYLALAARQDSANPWGSLENHPAVLLCPSDLKASECWDGTSYAYSMAFYHSPEQINAMTKIEDTWTPPGPPCIPQKRAAVEYSAQKVLVTEWLSNHESPHVGWDSWYGGRNYLFADGHCKYLEARRINPANDGWPDVNLTRDGIAGKDVD